MFAQRVCNNLVCTASVVTAVLNRAGSIIMETKLNQFLTFKLMKIVCHSCSCGYRPTILLGIYVNLLFFSRKNLKNEIYKVNFIVNSFFGLDDYYI